MSLVLSHNIIGSRTGNRNMEGPQMHWGGVSPGYGVAGHATKASKARQPGVRACTEKYRQFLLPCGECCMLMCHCAIYDRGCMFLAMCSEICK